MIFKARKRINTSLRGEIHPYSFTHIRCDFCQRLSHIMLDLGSTCGMVTSEAERSALRLFHAMLGIHPSYSASLRRSYTPPIFIRPNPAFLLATPTLLNILDHTRAYRHLRTLVHPNGLLVSGIVISQAYLPNSIIPPTSLSILYSTLLVILSSPLNRYNHRPS